MQVSKGTTFATEWHKGFYISFVCEKRLIVALWYSPSFLYFSCIFLLCILSPSKYIFFKLFTHFARLLTFAFILGLTLLLSNIMFAFLLNPPPPHTPPSQLLFVSQFGLYGGYAAMYICVSVCVGASEWCVLS